jgi:hypothetical protein
MPAHLTYEQAAPSTEGSHYALSLIRAAKIRSGQDVLVNGATGAIGSASASGPPTAPNLPDAPATSPATTDSRNRFDTHPQPRSGSDSAVDA